MDNKIPKLCLFCNNFYYDPGSPYYSEYTPGWLAEVRCSLQYWDDSENPRQYMLMAQTCKDFELDKFAEKLILDYHSNDE